MVLCLPGLLRCDAAAALKTQPCMCHNYLVKMIIIGFVELGLISGHVIMRMSLAASAIQGVIIRPWMEKSCSECVEDFTCHYHRHGHHHRKERFKYSMFLQAAAVTSPNNFV